MCFAGENRRFMLEGDDCDRRLHEGLEGARRAVQKGDPDRGAAHRLRADQAQDRKQIRRIAEASNGHRQGGALRHRQRQLHPRLALSGSAGELGRSEHRDRLHARRHRNGPLHSTSAESVFRMRRRHRMRAQHLEYEKSASNTFIYLSFINERKAKNQWKRINKKYTYKYKFIQSNELT